MAGDDNLFYVLVAAIIACFLALLVLHIYFRIKVFKAYKTLVQNRIDFDVKAIFNNKLLHNEVIPQYPAHKDEILSFVKNLKRAISLASLFLILIFTLGGILMYYRT